VANEKTIKRGPLELVCGDKKFTLQRPKFGTLLDLLEFQERIQAEEINIYTKDGFTEFGNFLITLYNHPDLTFEILRDADMVDMFQSMNIKSIEAWVSSFQADLSAADGESEKKDISQP